MVAELARVHGDEGCAMRCPWVIGMGIGEADSGVPKLNGEHYRTATVNAQTGVESPGTPSRRTLRIRSPAWMKRCATRLWFQIELPLEKGKECR